MRRPEVTRLMVFCWKSLVTRKYCCAESDATLVLIENDTILSLNLVRAEHPCSTRRALLPRSTFRSLIVPYTAALRTIFIELLKGSHQSAQAARWSEQRSSAVLILSDLDFLPQDHHLARRADSHFDLARSQFENLNFNLAADKN